MGLIIIEKEKMVNKILSGYNTATQISNILNNLSDVNQEEKTRKANEITESSTCWNI
jgi:hypothetical protein